MHDVSPIGLHAQLVPRSQRIAHWVNGAVTGTALLSFLIAAAVLLWQAQHERHDLIHRGLTAAAAAAVMVDRETQALGNTLRGLSRSPLLEADDLASFRRQLVATPRPEGSRFVLWTARGQLINTVVPIGGALPSLPDMPRAEERMARLRQAGLVLSERLRSPLDGRWMVAVSLWLDHPQGRPERALTLVVPEEHLAAAAQDAVVADGWRTLILDRRLQPLAGPALPPDFIDRLSDQEHDGHFTAGTGDHRMIGAFSRSGVSGYTALALAPAGLAEGPVRQALHRIALAGSVLLLFGIASATMLMRRVGPVDALWADAAATRGELAAANARLNAILESVSDCHFTLDRSYRITKVNAAAMRWWGLPRSTAAGWSYFALVGHDPAIDAALEQAIEHRREFRGELPSVYHPGRTIDYRVYPSPEGASVFFSDVTERNAALLTIREERELLQSSLDALSAHVAFLDEGGTIIAVNAAWRRFARDNGFGDPAHGIGASYLAACAAEEPILRGMEALVAGAESRFHTVYRCNSPDGQRWFQLWANRFLAGGKVRIIVAHEDITDVIDARVAMGEMSERLLTLQEEERQRIAAELHDSTAQHLVAAGLHLMRVDPFIERSAGKRIIDEIDRSLESALKELRVFTYLLHPRELETEGLAGAVRSFTDGFSDRTALPVSVRIAERIDGLPLDLQRTLLRIAQEALTNVHRHAGASRVVVALRLTSGGVILCIGDDGRGMRRPSPSGHQTLGVGIPGMRIRLHQFGGSLRIRSSRQGTIVRAFIPHEGWNIGCNASQEAGPAHPARQAGE
ncbi:PAS domain-containing protein [Microvirga sp. HBU67558]|uniref:PAS domain-containing protein n=1 Tax=Microvirga TaxID=186650 RepID=UPI001B375E3C|nr:MULTISPECIES: PAS domain-containing protein [unclassified Microvirga]MBQ0823858.1 PAS domain-containing protein [Microvirga sp. HBU67558]